MPKVSSPVAGNFAEVNADELFLIVEKALMILQMQPCNRFCFN
jgi:hypothetical protein